ncbi:MAG: hypothetical protein ACK4KV_17850 [Rhodocyclaceae bacterium]
MSRIDDCTLRKFLAAAAIAFALGVDAAPAVAAPCADPATCDDAVRNTRAVPAEETGSTRPD